MSSVNPYKNNPGKTPYLACNFQEGMHPSERIATFRTTNAEPGEYPLLVMSERRICIDPKALENMATVDIGKRFSVEGCGEFLEIMDIFRDDGKNSIIKIPDKGNGGTSRKSVPDTEIVWI